MPKKVGIVFVILGAVLILSALLLLLYNKIEEDHAAQEAEVLLNAVQSVISERVHGEQDLPPTTTKDEHQSGAVTDERNPTTEESEQTAPIVIPELSVVEIDGYGYIGYISIPKFELELPIMSDWDYKRLKLAPCRQFGSTKTDDLVIVAHNYKRHFAYLSALTEGDTVTFVDMDGEVNSYAVTKVKTLAPTAVDEVQNSGHDLVLYTCTYGGKTRVVVFCDRISMGAA